MNTAKQYAVFDPMLLALSIGEPSDLEACILAVSRWSQLTMAASLDELICVSMPGSTISKLQEQHLFPSRERIARLIRDQNLGEVYTANDVVNALNNIMQRAIPYEEIVHFPEVLIDPFLPPAPTCPSNGLDECGSVLLAETLPLILFHREVVGADAWLISHQYLQPVDMSVVVLMGGAHMEESALLREVSGTIPVAVFVGQLCKGVQGVDVWTVAEEQVAISIALDLEVALITNLCGVMLSRAPGYALVPPPTFRIGDQFLRSLCQWQAARDGNFAAVTLQKCARVIARVEQGQDFRVDEKTSSKARVRSDGAVAKRLHVTSGGVALRLMYWRFPDGTVELANVGGKAELRILE